LEAIYARAGNSETVVVLPKSMAVAASILLSSLHWPTRRNIGTLNADNVAADIDKAIAAMAGINMAGMIAAFPFFPGEPWLQMNGQVVDGNVYPALLKVAPAGWVSGSNITLPDYNSGMFFRGDDASVGGTGGQDAVSLTVSEIPAHDHDYTPPVANIDLEAPGAPDIVAAGVGTTAQTSQTGSGAGHENRPPFVNVVWVIWAR
jgi:microcystin-dependent protein